MHKHSTNQSDNDETEIVLATRELILSTLVVLNTRNQFIERIWWPLEHAEQICSSHCSWNPTEPHPLRFVATEFREAAANLKINVLL